MDSMEKKQFIITGIGTDVGKTVVSAIFAEALKAFYWKPVQAGELENSDSHKVKSWTTNDVTVLPEKFTLKTPVSPHFAACNDQIVMKESDFILPEINENLIIEGAGGLMVPVNNDGLLFIDLFKNWNLPVIVVSKHYVGSINHTLLTIEALKAREIPVLGIVYVGFPNDSTESIIYKKTSIPKLTTIPWVDSIDFEFIQHQANLILESNLFKLQENKE